jgi:hypothetical protein
MIKISKILDYLNLSIFMLLLLGSGSNPSCNPGGEAGPDDPTYPECLGSTTVDHRIEFDYMLSSQVGFNGDFRYEGDYSYLTDAFNEAGATISIPYSNSNPYGLMDAENSLQTFRDIATAYLFQYCDYTSLTDGYFVSIDRILNYPNQDAGGVTWIISGSGTVNPNPVFLFTGYIRDIAPSAYRSKYVVSAAIHELGHQIAVIHNHSGHGQENENCCVMKPSLFNGFNSTCNFQFCGNHLCLLHESIGN